MRRTILIIGLFFCAFSVSLSCDRQPEAKNASEPQKNSTDARGPTAKELYELSERCGKTCAQLYKEKVGKEGAYSDKGEHGIRGYNSHYNAKLNKCFILTMDESYGPKGVLLKLLFDINENKEYGELGAVNTDKNAVFKTKVMGCSVLEKRCESSQEWDTLVKPFMEE